MRDPSAVALYALHLTAGEVAAVLGGRPIWRPVWPPQAVQAPGGAVVGLSTGGHVVGEATLLRAEPAPQGGALWTFGEARLYPRPVPHPEAFRSRRALSPMPPVPSGAVTGEDPRRPAPMW